MATGMETAAATGTGTGMETAAATAIRRRSGRARAAEAVAMPGQLCFKLLLGVSPEPSRPTPERTRRQDHDRRLGRGPNPVTPVEHEGRQGDHQDR